MKKLITALAALAAVCALAPVASAGQATATEIDQQDAFEADNQNYAAGVIRSQKPKCRANRKIQFEIREEGATRFTPFDVTRSSRQSAWALRVPSVVQINADYRFRAPRQKVGDSTVCAQDTAPLIF